MAVPDLTRSIQFRGIELNVTADVFTGGQNCIQGCATEAMDISMLELRQYGQPAALVDGIDVGGVWLGARHVSMKGEVYGISKGDAMDRLAALETIMIPDSGTFGYYNLTFYTVTVASGAVQKTLELRPGGLRFPVSRTRHGVDDANPLAISWECVLYAKKPSIT